MMITFLLFVACIIETVVIYSLLMYYKKVRDLFNKISEENSDKIHMDDGHLRIDVCDTKFYPLTCDDYPISIFEIGKDKDGLYQGDIIEIHPVVGLGTRVSSLIKDDSHGMMCIFSDKILIYDRDMIPGLWEDMNENLSNELLEFLEEQENE